MCRCFPNRHIYRNYILKKSLHNFPLWLNFVRKSTKIYPNSNGAPDPQDGTTYTRHPSSKYENGFLTLVALGVG